MQSTGSVNDSANASTPDQSMNQENLSWIPTIYIKSTHFYHPKSSSSSSNNHDDRGGDEMSKICIIDKGYTSTIVQHHNQQQQTTEMQQTKNDNAQLVNLALFLDDSTTSESSTLSIFRSYVLGYPPKAVLELENFNGLEDEKNVVSALKNAAAAGGTVLVVESVNKGRSKYRLKEILLVCDHYRLSRGKKTCFGDEDHHVAAGIEIQRFDDNEHGQSAGKKIGNSSNKLPVIANGSSTSMGQSSLKRTKKRKSVRPTCSRDCCDFSLTIFCSAVVGSEGKWFVSAARSSKRCRFKHTHHLPTAITTSEMQNTAKTFNEISTNESNGMDTQHDNNSLVTFDVDCGSHKNEDESSERGFGNLPAETRTPNMMGFECSVPQKSIDVDTDSSLQVSMKKTHDENFELFMRMSNAAKTPEQKQYMYIAMCQLRNKFLAENNSAAVQSGKTT